MINVEELIAESKLILESNKVKYIIGYGRSASGFKAKPVFIDNPDKAEQLIWDPTCVHNLARFVVEEKKSQAKQKEPDKTPIGVIVKGCDSRAMNVLLQENYIERDDVYIIGVSCEETGVVDEKKLLQKFPKSDKDQVIEKIEFGDKDEFIITINGQKKKVKAADVLAQRCIECKASYPIVYDDHFGDEVSRSVEEPFKSVEKIDSMTTTKRWDFWQENFDKCIRCYGCRSVCPMCYCEECIVDSINYGVTPQTPPEEKANKIKWAERSAETSESSMFHLIRAIHLAGRCIDCGECERVCPMDIPVRYLNKKLEKEAKELYDYEAGFEPDKPSLVSSFRDEDTEDFIR